MGSMTDSALVFDRAALRLRRARLARSGTAPSFLRLEVAERLLDRLDDIRRPTVRVLELGAQRGELRRALELAGRLPELFVEAESSLDMARSDTAQRRVVVAEEEAMPFAEGAFDAVLSVMSLHLVNDLPGALLQAQRTLRPDGFLLAAFAGGETLRELRYALTQAEIELTGGATMRVAPFVDVRDAGALLQRAGFALPIADSDHITVRYQDPWRLLVDLRELGETNMLVARPKTPIGRGVLARAMAIYRERFALEDGTVPATFDIVFLTGWRPHASQPQPLRRGSGQTSLAAVLDPARSRPGGAFGGQ
jgi:SAM-dependent methyltransferase